MKKVVVLPALIIFTMTSSSISFADTINKDYKVKPIKIDAMSKASFNPNPGSGGFNGGYEDPDEDNTLKTENIDESKIKITHDSDFVEKSIFQNETGHLIVTINEDKLNGEFKNAIRHIGINDTKYEHYAVSIDKASWFKIYIPYKFLKEGENNIYFYLNDEVYKYSITTPIGFTDLKLTPDLSASEMGEGNGSILKLKPKNLNAEEWINNLKKDHISIENRTFGTYVRPNDFNLNIDKENNEISISFLQKTYTFDTYELEFKVPGFINTYKVITPLHHPPKLYGEFNENGNLNYIITTEEGEDSYLTNYVTKIVLTDEANKKTTLQEGVDYNINRDKLEIKPKLFNPDKKYTIKLYANSYISTQLNLTVPNRDFSVNDCPSFDIDYIEQGKDLEIKHIDDRDWLNNITKITIFDPRSFETRATKYTIKNNTIIIDKEYFFNRQGKYKVEIESKGYTNFIKDLQAKKYADAKITIRDKSLLIGFKDKSNGSLYDIVDNDLSVKLNGKEIEFDASLSSIIIPKDKLTQGENTIKITHANYKDIIKTINYTGDNNITVNNIENNLDKTELDTLIAKANSLKPSEGKAFTKVSKEVFDKSLLKAKDLSRKNSSSLDEITKVIKELETSINNLVEVAIDEGKEINKEPLIKIIEEAKSKKPSKNKEFTGISKKVLDKALKEAIDTISKDDYTQEEIDNVKMKLEEAISNLEEKDLKYDSFNSGSNHSQHSKKDIVIIGGPNSINMNFEYGLSKYDVTRIAGDDRYKTAVEVSKKFKNSDIAIIANGENYTDVMSSSPLANKLKAPLLLTRQNSVPNEVKNELERLNVKNVIIIGGYSSISNNVESLLKDYKIDRIDGIDRYETSALIAQKVADSNSNTKKAILVDGTNFPDAIAMSTLAVKEKMPILLTTPDSLPKETTKIIKDLEIKEITIGGGSKSVSDSIESNLKTSNKVKRIAGSDRYETSHLVAKNISPDFKSIVVTTGENYPDAIVGSVYSTQNNQVLIMSNNSRVEDFLSKIK